MADHAAANETIWPTDGDVGTADGDGDGLFEVPMTDWLAKATQTHYVVSGLTVPASDADLNVDVAAGDAVIDGKLVSIPATTSVALANNATNYLYLKLIKSSGKVTGAAFEVNTTGTPPSDSVKLAELVTSAGATTGTTDCRVTAPFTTGANRMAVYTTPGTYYFLARTAYVTVEKLGGGGGGGGSAAASGGGGGGGGAGAWVLEQRAVTPGQLYAVVVGAAGTAGASEGAGGDGGDSTFGTDSNPANGGSGGAGGASGAGGAAGAAATVTSTLFSLAGTAGGSKSGTTGGAAGVPAGPYQPTPVYGGGAAGTTGTGAAVGTAGLPGLVIVRD